MLAAATGKQIPETRQFGLLQPDTMQLGLDRDTTFDQGHQTLFDRCQRDLAIYTSFLLFGIIFAINQKRIKAIPWLAWFVLGVLPMAFDGVSQFPSLMAGLPVWLPLRESTPFLRSLTGALFGLTSAWYLFPFMEESMRETRAVLSTKKAVAEESGDVR